MTADHLATAIPIAVLGDSDSHSYQDRISFASGSPERGGVHRTQTLQWTEILSRLRGGQLDLGPWGTLGSRGSMARLQQWLCLPSRAPKKEDFLHNFAVSGAVCEDLLTGPSRQSQPLVRLMDQQPQKWKQGLVVIRIGANSFGKADSLSKLAQDPAAPEVRAKIDDGLSDIRGAVALIRDRHPQTRLVLVGIFDNANWPKYFGRWHSPTELTNIAAGLDRFDDALRVISARDGRCAFFDDRAWFKCHWGARSATGRPDYAKVMLANGFEVTNSAGDDPHHAVLNDGHAGLAWNFLWVQSLVELLRARFEMALAPIEDGEIRRLMVVPQARGANR
jgi:hypothetical protein